MGLGYPPTDHEERESQLGTRLKPKRRGATEKKPRPSGRDRKGKTDLKGGDNIHFPPICQGKGKKKIKNSMGGKEKKGLQIHVRPKA